jgi:hypothetical protein
MIRSTHAVKARWITLALPFALLAAGCGPSETGDGTAPNGNGTGGSGNTGSGSGGNAGSGTVGAGGSGTVGAGGSGTVGAGGSGTVGAGGSGTDGAGGSGTDGAGGSGTVGAGGSGGDPSILPPPETGKGIQIATPEFVLRPGDEVFRCYHVEVPADAEVNVAKFVSKMATGSHHFILYQAATAAQPNGTLQTRGCAGGLSSQWVYASGSPDSHLTMPQGVAMPFKARQPLQFDMHYINTTTSDLRAKVVLNLEYAQGTFQKAASLISFNRSINIPPNGTQTVSGTCTPPPGAKFFVMSTHTHKYATLAEIRRGSATGEQLVHTTDWEHPDVALYDAPNFLTFGANERLYYSCTYNNPTTNTITVGESAERNEMCMAVSYYFPAASGGSCR